MRVKFYAHTAENAEGHRLPEESGCWQALATHLRNVADQAKEFARPLGLGDEAELAGLLHDLGKYGHRFQQRLRNPAIHGINHWAAGATCAAELGAADVAFAVDGHHTGLPPAGGDGLKQTVAKMRDDGLREEFCKCPEPVGGLVRRLEEDGIRFSTGTKAKRKLPFSDALRTRMLFSCLVDADFLDTEAHFQASANARRIVPGLAAERALEVVLGYLESLPGTGSVNARRRQLLADCLSAAERAPGLFTLTAPTGSGKTLASLAFALRHIARHNADLADEDPRRFRRIIVVIPFTSIIEQTAAVYRSLFEDTFGPDYLLEHHSALAPREVPDGPDKDAEDERIRRARLAAENWASPLVVTTNVQFFESLFGHRPSDCRKLHNIGRSVILFDEVQTLPPDRVPSLLSAVKLLVGDYGATAVFMTATQPAFAAAGEAVIGGWNPTPITVDESGLAEALRRTRIELPGREETTSWDEVARRMLAEPQVLCVVNTTAEARDLFKRLQAVDPSAAWHLSSKLCPAHRREKLEAIRSRLRSGVPCRLVSTQLIEAGVDVDFPFALRALGPLDSIVQTAGRCNREGKSADPRPVVVFRPEELKTPPGAYRIATAATVAFLNRHPDAAERLHQPEFYASYFRELYGLLGPQSQKEDKLFAACEEFEFPKAAELARLISNQTRAVLVKWKDGEALAEKLRREKHLTADQCRAAQQFSVNLYQSEFFDAQTKGYIYQPAEAWDFWVWNSGYDENLGLGHAEAEDFNL